MAAEDLAVLAEPLLPGPGIVKDYVKSRKHEGEQACFIPDLADPAGLSRVVRRLGCRFVTTDVGLPGRKFPHPAAFTDEQPALPRGPLADL
ncbi:hypothetical protein ABZY02_18320 [Streptomyces sp. NPDC006649]|uniref:hypothetical protein n=1 Tax=Streptomyces sp. NPDC006649 TaxID=3156896 RepID=UPI0033AE06BB